MKKRKKDAAAVLAGSDVVGGCVICTNNDNEDCILLCDGKDCNREIHVYCMRPIVSDIPEGDWYCQQCSAVGSSASLQRYLDGHNEDKMKMNLTSKEKYKDWLYFIQRRVIPFSYWSIDYIDDKFTPKPSNFDPSSESLIGKICRLYSILEENYHIGRIINRKYDEMLGCWLHLIHFKVGADDRNQSLSEWIVLEEHACIIGGDIIWSKPSKGHHWWPAQCYYQSGLDMIMKNYKLIKTKYRNEKAFTHPVHNIEGSIIRTDNARDDTLVLLYYYAYNYFTMSPKKYMDTVTIPLRNKVPNKRDSAKKLLLAYAMADIEYEEQRRVWYTYANGIPENTVGLEGLHVRKYTDLVMHLKTLKSNGLKLSDAANLYSLEAVIVPHVDELHIADIRSQKIACLDRVYLLGEGGIQFNAAENPISLARLKGDASLEYLSNCENKSEFTQYKSLFAAATQAYEQYLLTNQELDDSVVKEPSSKKKSSSAAAQGKIEAYTTTSSRSSKRSRNVVNYNESVLSNDCIHTAHEEEWQHYPGEVEVESSNKPFIPDSLSSIPSSCWIGAVVRVNSDGSIGRVTSIDDNKVNLSLLLGTVADANPDELFLLDTDSEDYEAFIAAENDILAAIDDMAADDLSDSEHNEIERGNLRNDLFENESNPKNPAGKSAANSVDKVKSSVDSNNATKRIWKEPGAKVCRINILAKPASVPIAAGSNSSTAPKNQPLSNDNAAAAKPFVATIKKRQEPSGPEVAQPPVAEAAQPPVKLTFIRSQTGKLLKVIDRRENPTVLRDSDLPRNRDFERNRRVEWQQARERERERLMSQRNSRYEPRGDPRIPSNSSSNEANNVSRNGSNRADSSHNSDYLAELKATINRLETIQSRFMGRKECHLTRSQRRLLSITKQAYDEEMRKQNNSLRKREQDNNDANYKKSNNYREVPTWEVDANNFLNNLSIEHQQVHHRDSQWAHAGSNQFNGPNLTIPSIAPPPYNDYYQNNSRNFHNNNQQMKPPPGIPPPPVVVTPKVHVNRYHHPSNHPPLYPAPQLPLPRENDRYRYNDRRKY